MDDERDAAERPGGGVRPRAEGVSRREIFRLGAVAAAAVTAGAAFVPGTRAAFAAPADGKSGSAGIFRVRIDDVELKFVRAVEFGPVRTNLSVVAGNPPTLTYFGLEPSMTIDIVVSQDQDPALAEWYTKVKQGASDDRRSVLVELLTANGKIVVRAVRARDCIVESFSTSIVAGQERNAADVYVVRCPLANGGLTVEEP